MERPRYFPRQLITPVEMTLEQTYFRDKLRRPTAFYTVGEWYAAWRLSRGS